MLATVTRFSLPTQLASALTSIAGSNERSGLVFVSQPPNENLGPPTSTMPHGCTIELGPAPRSCGAYRSGGVNIVRVQRPTAVLAAWVATRPGVLLVRY